MLLVWKHPQICKFSFDQIMTPRVGWGHNRGGLIFTEEFIEKNYLKSSSQKPCHPVIKVVPCVETSSDRIQFCSNHDQQG